MTRLERFTNDIERLLSPQEIGPVLYVIDLAADSRSINLTAAVQMLPEYGQQLLACEGLRGLVEEINGGRRRAPDTPLEALQRQLVNDELTVEEFETRRAALESEQVTA